MVGELYRLMGRAGKTIRALAWDYRWQGAGSWALAAGCVGATVGLPILLKFSLGLPLYWVGLGAGLGIILFYEGVCFFDRLLVQTRERKGRRAWPPDTPEIDGFPL